MSTGEGRFRGELRAPRRTERHDALETLTQSVRRLLEASVATGLDVDDLVAVAAEIDAISAKVEAVRDDDPWLARAAGSVLADASQFMGINPAMGVRNPAAPEVHVQVAEDASVSGTVRFRLSHVGPPYRAHGGVVASVFDQVLGLAAIAGGSPGYTASMTVKYRKATPLDTDVRVEARFVESEGRRGRTVAYMYDEDGNVTAEAEGLFVTARGETT